MLEILVLAATIAAFVLYLGLVMPFNPRREQKLPGVILPQYRSRSVGRNKWLDALTNEGLRRAMNDNSTNRNYLRQLKQANWYWAPGEPSMPVRKAPFWNVETLWTEKIVGALVLGGGFACFMIIIGLIVSLTGAGSMLPFLVLGLALGGVAGFFAFKSPDSSLAGAARKRQNELALEMGFRLAELRADVMAGNTIQRAIRNLSVRPGGPFVEELRRAVAVLDITKDDTLAMDQLIERNEGNEIVVEFANSLKMVSRQGGQISPVLNVLSDLAQQRLRMNIQAQARRNLQEMTRPIGLSSMVVTSLLIIAPALAGVLGSMGV